MFKIRFIQVIVACTLLFSVVPVGGTEASVEANFPVTFKDDFSTNAITINKQPNRIISLYPSNTEIVYALGKGSKVVGVSDYCNYPAAVSKLPKLGGLSFNAEKILKMDPDLILLHTSQAKSHKEALSLFKRAGVQIVAIGDANSFSDAYGDIRIIGKAIGASQKAESVIKTMKSELNLIMSKSKKVKTPRKVWVEVSNWGGLWTTGKNTFMNEMLSSIGAINVAKSYVGWTSLSEEKIVELRPQIIIVTYAKYDPDAVKSIKNRSSWKTIPAVKNNNVFTVDGDSIERPGPRLIDGVEALAKAIYPEVFK